MPTLQASCPMVGTAAARAVCISGAGNRFYLIDLRAAALPVDAAGQARLACADSSGFAPDGLLWVMDGARPGSLRMVLHNADGSRPEACGNALRCLVHWAVEQGLLTGLSAFVETDGGEREVRWRRAHGELDVNVSLGRPEGLPECSLEDMPGAPTFQRVTLANPHAVLCVEGLTDGHLEEFGRRLQDEVAGGTNVELVARTGEGVAMRVWERGVGPTQACGTGSAAAAWVAAKRWNLEWPIRVRQPGGVLTIDRDSSGQLWLAGPVSTHGEVAFTGDEWVTCSTS